MKITLPPNDPTLVELDAVMKAEGNGKPSRGYLGMSEIGGDCSRKLWSNFRFVALTNFEADTLRNFDDGHYSEDLTAARLRKIPGIRLMTHGSNGNQFGFSDLGGHFKGHMDGGIEGIYQAPKTWHVWEHKCCNETKFKKIAKLREKVGEKKIFQEWDFVYYGQGILYMHYTGMDRHYTTVATSGSRKYESIRTDANPDHAKDLIDKAEYIITMNVPVEKVSDNPDYFQCKWCQHADNCHGNTAPFPSCRSCIYAQPVMDGDNGDWLCKKHNMNPTVEQQLEGCEFHTVIPQLIENWAEQIDAAEGIGVKYRNKLNDKEFWNGVGDKAIKAYSSAELYACTDKALIGDDGVEILRNNFDGEIINETV